ncbi:hypothetical protein ED28_01265 [[Pantoea] beijingensis]|uniref:YdgH/BhsA/McbA-like domain-containing protein n=1 Tax=[Pantoea] beijingensis TaxID=1324864 RepID=A0A443IHM4_9GAMM|nr:MULTISPECIES: YdgH/BhsA/McbA-like domain containing protein [Erwiniaceae]RWR03645.1 hypothetical protein ED28_01265 [[Pantoea] beijingensis]
MKNVKASIAAATLIAMSFGTFAAEQVSSEPQQQHKIGVVSANSNNLDSLVAQLNEKADAAGAKSFRITSAAGQNLLHGTAVIYQ